MLSLLSSSKLSQGNFVDLTRKGATGRLRKMEKSQQFLAVTKVYSSKKTPRFVPMNLTRTGLHFPRSELLSVLEIRLDFAELLTQSVNSASRAQLVQEQCFYSEISVATQNIYNFARLQLSIKKCPLLQVIQSHKQKTLTIHINKLTEFLCEMKTNFQDCVLRKGNSCKIHWNKFRSFCFANLSFEKFPLYNHSHLKGYGWI